MEIRRMTHADIVHVISLHARVLPTVTARMGSGILTAFYTTMINHPDVHVALVVTDGYRIIGALAATKNGQKTQNFLTAAIRDPAIIFGVCTALLRRLVTLKEIVERLQTEKQIRARMPSLYQIILTITVDTHAQHTGVGSRLLAALFREISPKTDILVDTEVTNNIAQQFYTKHGFQHIGVIGRSVLYKKTLP